MKKYFKFLKEDKLLKKLFILSFILIILTIIYALINYSKLPPLLPIFNQLPWGEERLSPTPGLFIPPIIIIIIFATNIFLSSVSYQISPLISRLFAVTTFLTALLTFLFVVRTVLLIS